MKKIVREIGFMPGKSVTIEGLNIISILCIVSTLGFSQVDSVNAVEDIRKFQQELNEEYNDASKSPLSDEDRKQFKGHEFFPVNLKFRVAAKLIVTNNTPFFNMKTTTMRVAEERIYGYVEFSLEGKKFRLPVYQSSKLMKTEEYKDYLFFPFTDLTNGEETYHGGRYIDLRIPQGEVMVIDFNKACNPYCTYNSKFSCPIVPRENHLEIKVLAGIIYHEK